MSTLKSAVGNRFAVLPLDATGPPLPVPRAETAPARPSYAQATRESLGATTPARAASPTVSGAPIPPVPTKSISAPTVYTLRVSELPPAHAFRTIDTRRVLAALRSVVSSRIDHSALLRCDRLASGDLRVLARSAIAIKALTMLVESAYSGIKIESPSWRRSVVLHCLPFTVKEGEVVSAIEDALERDEGASGVTAARWLTREKEGKTAGSYVIEMASEEDVSALIQMRHLAVRHGSIHVDMVRAHSPEEREAARAAPTRRIVPRHSTPQPEGTALPNPLPSAPPAVLPTPQYGDMGSGNLVSLTPTVTATRSRETSDMSLVTPSPPPAPVFPLESPRKLPSLKFGEDDSESEKEPSWAEETEEAIEAARAKEEEEVEEGKVDATTKLEEGKVEATGAKGKVGAATTLQQQKKSQSKHSNSVLAAPSRKKHDRAGDSSEDELLMKETPPAAPSRHALRPRKAPTPQ
ncbi:hypothetical protein JCM10908_005700 [Rhodotorula pacifica]|uniref:uncharacterized protein n=1 Tax=Rhodotorula pacifica TaxID=1495444 RepID=UPI003174D553